MKEGLQLHFSYSPVVSFGVFGVNRSPIASYAPPR